jgi:ADP-ribosylglycohydrolase
MANSIEDGSRGCILGGAVADALGGPTEGRTPEAIRERYGGWVTDFVGPFHLDWQTARPISPLHKGDGHVTDDTLMVMALAAVYADVRDHLTAFDMASRLVPKIADEVTYIPEFERDTVLVNRLFYAEKYLLLRLRFANIDPREAGVGNVVNCGAAMYMAPVGIVNAGDPEGAYREAIDLAGAHQSSYGREAAGVYAAAIAEALRPGSSVDSVVATCLELARDGTRDAIAAVTEAARGVRDWEAAIPVLRDAVRPFDSVGEQYRDPHPDARRPSRTKAIEELPVALGMFVMARGEYLSTVLGGVNYGRDSDSIASMGGAISGALHGAAAVPADWSRFIQERSRKDLERVARDLATVARELLERDRERWNARLAAFPRAVNSAPLEVNS